MITFTIDELVPCLIDNETGEIIETEVMRVTRKSFLQKFNRNTGWYVNWSKFDSKVEVYALVLKGTVSIQGLIAIQIDKDNSAVHIIWACTAPWNNKDKCESQRYTGVGGHLFAIAGNRSVEEGFDGYIYGEAANKKLYNYYINEFGAEPFPFGAQKHEYRIIVNEEKIKSIIERYTYEYSDDKL